MIPEENNPPVIYAETAEKGSFKFVEEVRSPYTYASSSRPKPGLEATCCCFSTFRATFAWKCGYCFVKIIALPENMEEVYKKDMNINHERIIDCGQPPTALAFLPKENPYSTTYGFAQYLVAGLENGNLTVWNVDLGELICTLSDHSAAVNALTFDPIDSSLMVSASTDRTLKVWDLTDYGNMTLTFGGERARGLERTQVVLDCAFSPNDRHTVASVGNERAVYLWNMKHKRSVRLRKRLVGHKNTVTSCSWSPNGALLATASHDTTVIVWDPVLSQQVLILGHQHPLPCAIYAGGANGSWVGSAEFTEDGSKILTMCEDNMLRLWDLWKPNSVVYETELRCNGYQCSASKGYIAVGKRDSSVTLAFDQTHDRCPSLVKLSRTAARRLITSDVLQRLNIPSTYVNYLSYKASIG
jgi:WD40 repeat protein